LVEHNKTDIEMEDVFMLQLASSYYAAYACKDESAGDHPGEPSTMSLGDAAGNLTEESRGICETLANRSALGILLHTIDNGARYVRVGRFKTAAKDSGDLSFAHVPYQDVEIV
jgi:hypothetical protein